MNEQLFMQKVEKLLEMCRHPMWNYEARLIFDNGGKVYLGKELKRAERMEQCEYE